MTGFIHSGLLPQLKLTCFRLILAQSSMQRVPAGNPATTGAGNAGSVGLFFNTQRDPTPLLQ